MSEAEKRYEVGRGRPPKEYQFSSDRQPTRRKKGPQLTAALKRRLRETDPDTGRLLVEDFAVRLIELAKEGNAAAIREVVGRIDGPLVQKIEGDGVTNYRLVIEYADAEAPYSGGDRPLLTDSEEKALPPAPETEQ